MLIVKMACSLTQTFFREKLFVNMPQSGLCDKKLLLHGCGEQEPCVHEISPGKKLLNMPQAGLCDKKLWRTGTMC